MKNKNQSGRTMLEMLAVLAIIGILSVMGIAGITIAMQHYRLNATTNQVKTAITALKSANLKLKSVVDADGVACVPGGSATRMACPKLETQMSVDLSDVFSEDLSDSDECRKYNTTAGITATICQSATDSSGKQIETTQNKENTKYVGDARIEVTMALPKSAITDKKALTVDGCSMLIGPHVPYDAITIGGITCSHDEVEKGIGDCNTTALCKKLIPNT